MCAATRILEAYLGAFLGYGWEDVHGEAERLEHAVSDVLIERMAAALGNPHSDPHGDPIPAPDGTIAEPDHTPLSDIPAGETAEIRRVDTSQPDRLRYIAGFGLTPGTRALVVDRQPFRGPITVNVGGTHHVLGSEIAGLLLCAASRTPRDDGSRVAGGGTEMNLRAYFALAGLVTASAASSSPRRPPPDDLFDGPLDGLTPSEMAAFVRGDAEFGRPFARPRGSAALQQRVVRGRHSGDGCGTSGGSG